MSRRVVIDFLPESADRYREGYAIVAIDVIRATTTATTAIHTGRRVYPARTSDEAFVLSASLNNPLLVGELGGQTPYGFDITNSPVAIAARSDVERPMVLVSSSGTQLVLGAAGSEAVYLSCLRNYRAVAAHVAARHERVAVIGAGTRGQFRREDQFGCALLAQLLMDGGFEPEGARTLDCVARWMSMPFDSARQAIRDGKSAEYLRKSGQEHDLDFVLGHVDDLGVVPSLVGREVVDAARATGADVAPTAESLVRTGVVTE